MALKELKILSIKDIFQKNLTLPVYQRPYRWSVNSSNQLFIDTLQAYKDTIEEYRIGSIILHEEKTNDDTYIYNIVDGQQRITTLAILLYCLNEQKNFLDNEQDGIKKDFLSSAQYDTLSIQAIQTNYKILSKRTSNLDKNTIDNYGKYLLNHCKIVQIVTDSEQEAFQFFDSQNSRGKELAPHDLLKSYHLREMKDEEENKKIKIINNWENVEPSNLEQLFKNYLYPLVNWYKAKDGLYYSSKK